MLLVIINVIIFYLICFKLFNHFSNTDIVLTMKLIKVIRYGEYDLSYIDKKANVIALLATVSTVVTDRGVGYIIEVPTKGFWQYSTSPDVRECLKKRMKSEKFKDFMSVSFPSNSMFSNLKVEENKIKILGENQLK